MKIGELLTKGTIIVAEQPQSTSCGIRYIKAGSILKVAKDTYEFSDEVAVYRNKRAEQEYNWHIILLRKVRLATEEEVKMYNVDKYFVETVKMY